MDARPEDVGFEQQLSPRRIENGLRLGGNPIHCKVFVHDPESVEILRGRFHCDKTAPSEDPTQLSGCGGQIQERPKAA